MKDRERSIKGYNLLWIWTVRPGLIWPFWLSLQSDSAVLWCICPYIAAAAAEHLCKPVSENCPYSQLRKGKADVRKSACTISCCDSLYKSFISLFAGDLAVLEGKLTLRKSQILEETFDVYYGGYQVIFKNPVLKRHCTPLNYRFRTDSNLSSGLSQQLCNSEELTTLLMLGKTGAKC